MADASHDVCFQALKLLCPFCCREVTLDQPTVLVVGSEGFGLRTNVRRSCQQLVRVEMDLPPGERVVDSLNVSVATGILLHQLLSGSRSLAAPPAS